MLWVPIRRSDVRALVVFESMFGNTKGIAEAIAEELGRIMETECLEVGLAPVAPEGFDLLIVGGPTHQFGLSRPDSRKGASSETEEPLISRGIGIREWIKGLPKVTGDLAATFDTSIRKPNLPGSAAQGAQKRLKRLGYRIVIPAEIFHVEGTTGPISDGELERAREWGAKVATLAA
jgi:hypothetical protein